MNQKPPSDGYFFPFYWKKFQPDPDPWTPADAEKMSEDWEKEKERRLEADDTVAP